jgi:hypothetical protein
MKNKRQAVLEVLGFELKEEVAAVYYFNVFEFVVYNDCELYLDAIEFGSAVIAGSQAKKDYQIFRFLLLEMRKLYPSKLRMLIPAPVPLAA